MRIGNRNGRGWLILSIAAFIAIPHSSLALVLCTTPDGKKYAGDSPPPDCVVQETLQNRPRPSTLELEDWNWESDGHSTHIVGTVRNGTGRELSYVEIDFSLFDEGDHQVGTAMTNVTNLQPDTTWKFRAYVSDPRARKAKPVKLAGH